MKQHDASPVTSEHKKHRMAGHCARLDDRFAGSRWVQDFEFSRSRSMRDPAEGANRGWLESHSPVCTCLESCRIFLFCVYFLGALTLLDASCSIHRGQLKWLVVGVGLQVNRSATHRRAGPLWLWSSPRQETLPPSATLFSWISFLSFFQVRGCCKRFRRASCLMEVKFACWNGHIAFHQRSSSCTPKGPYRGG